MPSERGETDRIKRWAGKVTSGGTIKPSVREHVRGQKMELVMRCTQQRGASGGEREENSLKLFINMHLSLGRPSKTLQHWGREQKS